MRDRIAALLTKGLYRETVLGDVPRSHAYYALRYGSTAKLANYIRVKRDYLSKRTTVTGNPYTLRIEPVSACNLRCPLCPTGTGETNRKKAVMSPETLEAILDKCGEHVLFVHLWIWGEPLLNKNLAELAKICHRRGIGTEVSSHMSVPLDEQRIDDLIRSGLDWLIISNDAASPETYSQYRVGGNYDLVIRNIKALVARKKALGS
ncbi:MAG TPA: radical SAM protein, partial [Bryobacteraceae bacterium]|nr:radical SAM protein [Bryobacteraceae bacterium]